MCSTMARKATNGLLVGMQIDSEIEVVKKRPASALQEHFENRALV